MINPLTMSLSPKEILKRQKMQYSDKLLLTGTIPAGESNLVTTSVTNLGHFYNVFFTGNFETLSMDGASIIDDGISHLRCQLRDGSNQKLLFSDYIPMDLLFSPGRVRSQNSTSLATDAPSNNLFYPFTFFHMFTVNSDVWLDVKNDSDADIKFNLVLNGIRVKKDLV